MQDEKAVQFFQEVLAKTRTGRIRWEPTADESAFIAALGGHFTLTVSEYPKLRRHINESQVGWALVLKDQDGRVLTRVTSDEHVPEADAQELYENAKRQALRVDEKLDSVLGELSKL